MSDKRYPTWIWQDELILDDTRLSTSTFVDAYEAIILTIMNVFGAFLRGSIIGGVTVEGAIAFPPYVLNCVF